MPAGRALEVRPLAVHEARGLVAEVPVLAPEGPDREELPQDRVGRCAPCDAHVREEHDVQDGLLVELEVQKMSCQQHIAL